MKLLSLLICFAMMLSGSYTAEDPNAPASTVVTIRDAVVYVQEEEFPLNPSITFGASTAEGGARIDFGMPLGENVLFPVQAKIDESGLGVLLGQSSTAYTLTPEFFDSLLEGQEIPDEIFTMLDAYSTLLGSMDDMPLTGTPEQNAAIAAKFFEYIGDAPTEEADFYADERDQTGTKVAFSLDNDQYIGLIQASIDALPAEYLEAYQAYMNAVMSLSGMPESSDYADLMAMLGEAITIDGEITYNDTSAVADMTLHLTTDPNAMYSAVYDEIAVTTVTTADENADPSAESVDPETTVDSAELEPVTFDIPVSLTIHSADYMEYAIYAEMDGIMMDMNMAIDGESISIYMLETAEDEVAIEFMFVLDPNEDGSTWSVTTFGVDTTDLSLYFSAEGIHYENESSTQCSFNCFEGERYYGASWIVDVDSSEITDRFADANREMISSIEEIESNTGLQFAAMSMMGDVEKLMTDDSIAALIELLNTPIEMEATIEEEVEIAENIEAIDFPEPEFGWIPEGYVLDDTQTCSESNYRCYVFINEESGCEIFTDLIYYGEDVYTDSLYSSYHIHNGEIQLLEGDIISVQRFDDNSAMATYDTGDLYRYLSCSDPNLTDDEIIQILTSITFPQTAE